MNHFLFSSDERYFPHLISCLKSLFNTHENDKNNILIHIISFDLTESQINILKRESGKYSFNIKVHDSNKLINNLFERYKLSEKIKKYIKKPAYHSLLVPTFLNEGKIIICDVDVLFLENTLGVFNKRYSDTIAVVPDKVLSFSSVIMESNKDFSNELIFNSGIIFTDIKFWNNEVGEILNLIGSYKHIHDPNFLEQDFLNDHFYKKWTPLPEKYNYIPQPYKFKIERNKDSFKEYTNYSTPAIIHFAGIDRPWLYSTAIPKKYRDLYWKYRNKIKEIERKPTWFIMRFIMYPLVLLKKTGIPFYLSFMVVKYRVYDFKLFKYFKELKKIINR